MLENVLTSSSKETNRYSSLRKLVISLAAGLVLNLLVNLTAPSQSYSAENPEKKPKQVLDLGAKNTYAVYGFKGDPVNAVVDDNGLERLIDRNGQTVLGPHNVIRMFDGNNSLIYTFDADQTNIFTSDGNLLFTEKIYINPKSREWRVRELLAICDASSEDSLEEHYCSQKILALNKLEKKVNFSTASLTKRPDGRSLLVDVNGIPLCGGSHRFVKFYNDLGLCIISDETYNDNERHIIGRADLDIVPEEYFNTFEFLKQYNILLLNFNHDLMHSSDGKNHIYIGKGLKKSQRFVKSEIIGDVALLEEINNNSNDPKSISYTEHAYRLINLNTLDFTDKFASIEKIACASSMFYKATSSDGNISIFDSQANRYCGGEHNAADIVCLSQLCNNAACIIWDDKNGSKGLEILGGDGKNLLGVIRQNNAPSDREKLLAEFYQTNLNCK